MDVTHALHAGSLDRCLSPRLLTAVGFVDFAGCAGERNCRTKVVNFPDRWHNISKFNQSFKKIKIHPPPVVTVRVQLQDVNTTTHRSGAVMNV
jgi:hypothetical protein